MSNVRRFELNSSKLFLTYPQCPVAKETCLDFLQTLLDIEHYIIAHELHSNGDDHLHCYLSLRTPFRTRDSTSLDLLIDESRYHGNYQGCRSAKNVIRYTTKSEDFIANVDVATLTNRKSVRHTIAEQLITGKRSLEEMLHEFPTLVYDYSKIKANMKMIELDLKKWEPVPDFLPNPWGLLLPSFVNDKKRHYWIYSREPNVGKTYLFGKPLADKFGAVITTNFTYWNVSNTTPIIILDDYNTAALNWHSLNQLADGTFGFRRFQGGIGSLDRYLIIILSNTTISELYPYAGKYLYSRYNELCVDKV